MKVSQSVLLTDGTTEKAAIVTAVHSADLINVVAFNDASSIVTPYTSVYRKGTPNSVGMNVVFEEVTPEGVVSVAETHTDADVGKDT